VRIANSCGNTLVSELITLDPCGLPVITTQPADQTVASGASATLSVAFTSATTTTVRWYRGAAGDKTTQVGTGTTLNTGPLTSRTLFWASLSNSCPGETQTRTVTVEVSDCTRPAITSLSQNQLVGKNLTTTLAVQATGTATLNYQWYEGASGDQSKPVGTNASTFTTPPVTATKEYWVKITNSCGEARSNAVKVEVVIPRRRAVRH
jgi:Ig-like domain CHU_C associated